MTGYNDKNNFTWEAVISTNHRSFHTFEFQDLDFTNHSSEESLQRTLTPIISEKELPKHSYLRDCSKFVAEKCEVKENSNGTLAVYSVGDFPKNDSSLVRRQTIIPGLPNLSLTKFESATLYDIYSKQSLEKVTYPSGPVFVEAEHHAAHHCAVLKVTKFISPSEVKTLFMQKRSDGYAYEYRIV